jgi:hypothetical protein
MRQQGGRHIHSRLSSRQIPDLLQTIFVAESLVPSRCIWIISPWISDIPVIDNRTNAFLAIEPSWVGGRVRLAQVLAKVVGVGTTVHLATRPDEHNSGFLERLREEVPTSARQLRVHCVDDLHEKGILGDGYYLSGSMNFTLNGISLNEEAVHYYTSPEIISETRLVFSSRWGGPVS